MLLHFRSSINDSHRKQTIFATFLQHVVSRYLKKQMKSYLAFQETKEWLWTFFVKQYFSKFFFLPFRCFVKNIYVQKLFSDRKHILKRFNILCDIQLRIYIINVQFIKPQKSFLLCEVFLCYFLKDECFRAWVSPAPGVDMITAGNGF